MQCLDDRMLIRLAGRRQAGEDKELTKNVKHLRECPECQENLKSLGRSLNELEEEIRFGGAFAS